MKKANCMIEKFFRASLSLMVMFSIMFLFVPLQDMHANQRIYDHDDWEYVAVDMITQVAGMTGPHDRTPVTAEMLSQSLSRVDPKTLPGEIQQLYEELVAEFEEPTAVYSSPTMFFDVSTMISPEVYLKIGDDATRSDWYHGYKERLPLIDFSFDFGWSEHVYGRISLPYKLRIRESDFNEIFFQNVFMAGTNEGYQRVMPFDAGVSLGSSFMNFYLGRGQLNMGRGESGNLFVADNFQYQDFAKLTFFDDFFSYDLTYTHFDQENPVVAGQANSISDKTSFDGPHQSRITHSYTFDIADKVALTISEGAVLQTQDALDIRMFNPFMFIHNWQGFEEDNGYWANNYAGIDFSAVLSNGFRLNIQFVLDQFQLPNEKSSGTNLFPNAFGALINVTHVHASSIAFWKNWFEVVYTSPYLYLNDIGDGNENMDMILGYYLTYGSDISYTGYKNGPDSIVLAYGGNFDTYDQRLSFAYTLMYRLHGERGIRYNANNNQTPTSISGSEHIFDFWPTGMLEHSFIIDIGVRYSFHPSFCVATGITYQYDVNHNNKDGDRWQNLQLAVSCSFDPMEFVK